MPVEGINLVAKNIIKFTNGFVNSVNKVMVEVKDVLDDEITRNMSLTDHSMRDLAKLDHPYAVRHGDQGLQLHGPNWLVHTQSGKLLASKSSGVDPAEIENGVLKSTAFVMVDKDIAQHAVFVVYGTSKMIPRPFLTMSKMAIAPDAKKLITTRLKGLKVE